MALQRCPVLMASRHGGHLPGEGPQLKLRVPAEEPAYLKVGHHHPAACGQVIQARRRYQGLTWTRETLGP
jgi:hypothetical protein